MATEQPLILVVDDLEEMVQLLREILGRDDFEVASFVDGREALIQAQQGKLEPSVAVLDYSMPTMDGISLAAALKDAVPGLKVILLTAVVEVPDIEAARESGVIDRLIHKPYPGPELVAAVNLLVRA